MTTQMASDEYPGAVDVLGSLSAFIAHTSDDDPSDWIFNRCLDALYEAAAQDDDPLSARENIDHLRLCFGLREHLVEYGRTSSQVVELLRIVDDDLRDTWVVVRDCAREVCDAA